jgi:hypothetical protein
MSDHDTLPDAETREQEPTLADLSRKLDTLLLRGSPDMPASAVAPADATGAVDEGALLVAVDRIIGRLDDAIPRALASMDALLADIRAPLHHARS